MGDLEEAQKEARLVALRLRQLHAAQHPVWDEAARSFRPAAWSDMAVLLRSPANKSESYAKEFARSNVPLQAARGGFYESTEISDLLSLLQLLDNPLQDVPVLAVLHSPLVGLTLDELATIRLGVKGPFWTALVLWHEARARGEGVRRTQSGGRTDGRPGCIGRSSPSCPWARRRFARSHGFSTSTPTGGGWRGQVSLARCLEAVLAETHYAEWLLTQPRGEQRHANVQRLLAPGAPV